MQSVFYKIQSVKRRSIANGERTLQELIEKTRSKSQAIGNRSAIVSGFGYLIYAAYLAEVEHKGSPFTRAVGGHFQVLPQKSR
jgi:hypothetical protein